MKLSVWAKQQGISYKSVWAVISWKAKKRLQRTDGPERVRDPGCHRPKGMAWPVIIPFFADEIPACESLFVPFE